MPILSEEVSLYPKTLLEPSASTDQHPWYVVYTRARHEKSLARHLHSNGCAFYLPMITKEQFSRGHRTSCFHPVFSGYLFYAGTSPYELTQMAPYCISRILPVENQQRLTEELRTIHFLISAGAPMTLEGRLVPGKRVRVKAGALKGLEGTIIRRNSSSRLLVAVDYLQQGVSVEIKDFMVEIV
jgi:hypothetical protein